MRLIAKLLAVLSIWFGIAHGQVFPLHVNSGGSSYFNGTNWLADAYYSGGSTDSDPGVIFNAGTARNIFATRRFADAFTYTFTNVPAATYQIDLYFTDWEATAAGQRTFDVKVNGATALSAYDIYVAAGNQSSTAHIEHITNVPVASSSLSIAFVKNGGSLPAQINGIVITQTGSLPATTLTGCQQIATPGSYVLASDILAPENYSSACLFFLNTGAGTTTILNCQGHSITNPSATFANILIADTVPNFIVRNCTFNVTVTGGSGIQVLRSSPSALFNNVIHNTSIFVGDSNNVLLSRNTVLDGGVVFLPIQQSQVSSVDIDSNTIDLRNATQLNSGIQASNLTSSIIKNNKIYGAKPYTDDAIVLGNASNVTIQGNTLAGASDAGIEFFGSNAGIQVLANSMDNVSRGIGGWYDLSLTNSLIDGNVVTNATLFAFNYAHALTDPNTFTVTFSGNRFSNNSVSEGCTGSCGGPSGFFEFTEDLAVNPRAPLPHTLVANNILTNNNFDLNAYGPRLNPPSGFIDGGHNVCSAAGIYPVAGYPLQCNTSSSCTSPANGQFRACYWSNESWNGTEAVNRLDAYPLSSNWGGGSPTCQADLAGLGYNCPNNMSASWTGNFQFDAGYYIFTTRAGGGSIAVYIDGAPDFTRFYALLPGYSSPFVAFMSAGTHTIRVTYVSNGFAGFADTELSWAKF